MLARAVRPWTATPEQCWFCLWDGYGWDNRHLLTPPGEPPVRLPDPIPESVRRGTRVHLPDRDYLLYAGPAEAVLAATSLADDGQTANLWWPDDHAWCVSSEVGLAWTYVGGPAGLIERLVNDERIEALPADPADRLGLVEDWVTGWAAAATADLLSAGGAVIATSRGTIHARLARSFWHRAGTLHTQSAGDNGVTGSGRCVLSYRGGDELRREIIVRLTCEILDLVGA